MKMYIPELGDQIKLTADWVFELHVEDRNSTLMEFLHNCEFSWENYRTGITMTSVIPDGSILKVDRIYIRKGASDYSSITFFWKDMSIPPKVVDRKITAFNYHGMPGHTEIYQKKIPKKPVRFWAKLSDVNNIEFDRV